MRIAPRSGSGRAQSLSATSTLGRAAAGPGVDMLRSMSDPVSRSADVVVFGATAGGVLAAAAAAGEGASVLLVEPGRHVGGMLTGGLSRTDVERQEHLVGGLAGEVFRRIGSRYGEPVAWRFEPHVAEDVLLNWVGDAGVGVHFGYEIDRCTVAHGRITRMTSPDGSGFEAATWIDASYEGDLLAAAGATFAVGRESRTLYGERWAGRREILPNPHQFRVPVSALDTAGGLLPGVVSYDEIGLPGEGDGKVQAYCYRLCLSTADDRLPLDDVADYDPSRYELLRRMFESLARQGIPPNLHDAIGISPIPGGKADVNSHGPVSTDLLGGAWEYATADAGTRAQIREMHRSWARGLLRFLATDAVVPAVIQDDVARYGYPADEFTDTGGWPHQLYVREARRLVGEYVLTEADVIQGRIPGDTVGLGGYNIDIREVQWVACPISRFPDIHQEVLVEGYLSVPVPAFGISYRALLPRRNEVENLLVSTCVSASAVAFASFRMEPQFMIAGHAAGIAAAQASRRGVAAHDVDVAAVRERLRSQGQILTQP